MAITLNGIRRVITTLCQMGTFDNLEAIHADNIGISQRSGGAIVAVQEIKVRCQCGVNFRGYEAITITLRNIVLGHLSFNFQQNVADCNTRFFVNTKCGTRCEFLFNDATFTKASNVFRSVERFFSDLCENRRIHGDCQCFAKLCSIRRTEIIMCDKFVKVKYQAVSRQQTINNNGTFALLNVFAKVIKALTTFQVMCFSTTEYRELCRFTTLNSTFDKFTIRYGSTCKCRESFTTKDFKGKSKFVGICGSLSTNRHRSCNFNICHN